MSREQRKHIPAVLFRTGVSSYSLAGVLPPGRLPETQPQGRTIIPGAGKAAVGMAACRYDWGRPSVTGQNRSLGCFRERGPDVASLRRAHCIYDLFEVSGDLIINNRSDPDQCQRYAYRTAGKK